MKSILKTTINSFLGASQPSVAFNIFLTKVNFIKVMNILRQALFSYPKTIFKNTYFRVSQKASKDLYGRPMPIFRNIRGKQISRRQVD